MTAPWGNTPQKQPIILSKGADFIQTVLRKVAVLDGDGLPTNAFVVEDWPVGTVIEMKYYAGYNPTTNTLGALLVTSEATLDGPHATFEIQSAEVDLVPLKGAMRTTVTYPGDDPTGRNYLWLYDNAVKRVD